MREFIENYWTQVAIVIGVIVFIVQKSYELKLKKKEIKFSRVQENKIIEIKAFYKSYRLLEMATKEYLHQTEFGEHSEENFDRIKKNIREKFIDFDYYSMTIKLFLNEKDTRIIDEIGDILEKARVDIGIWHIRNRSKSPQKDGWDSELNTLLSETFPKKLPALIKQLEASLRSSFDIK